MGWMDRVKVAGITPWRFGSTVRMKIQSHTGIQILRFSSSSLQSDHPASLLRTSAPPSNKPIFWRKPDTKDHDAFFQPKDLMSPSLSALIFQKTTRFTGRPPTAFISSPPRPTPSAQPRFSARSSPLFLNMFRDFDDPNSSRDSIRNPSKQSWLSFPETVHLNVSLSYARDYCQWFDYGSKPATLRVLTLL